MPIKYNEDKKSVGMKKFSIEIEYKVGSKYQEYRLKEFLTALIRTLMITFTFAHKRNFMRVWVDGKYYDPIMKKFSNKILSEVEPLIPSVNKKNGYVLGEPKKK